MTPARARKHALIYGLTATATYILWTITALLGFNELRGPLFGMTLTLVFMYGKCRGWETGYADAQPRPHAEDLHHCHCQKYVKPPVWSSAPDLCVMCSKPQRKDQT